jgi:putative SOS response-associated peptidase YedK
MCNLYSIRRPRDEVIGLFGISHVDDGVQLELPAVYPDTMAPIIRLDDNGARNLTMVRWGFPPPPKGGPRPVTNVHSGRCLRLLACGDRGRGSGREQAESIGSMHS